MSSTSAYKGYDMFYRGLWQNAEDINDYGYFRFSIVKDGTTRKEIVRNLEGTTGDFYIRTKSTIEFKPDDIVTFQGTKYVIIMVDSNRKEENETAFYKFRQNGNVNTYITLSKMG